MNKLIPLFILVFIPFLNAFAQPANDDYANAIDVSGIINSCSADAAYTTVNGTPDNNAGTCWNNSGPQFNVWFSFTAATTNMKVTVDRGGTKGSQRRTQIALWESDGTTPVACKIYAFDDEDVILEVVGGLTATNTYYISIDAFDVNYDGTFTLCLADNDISYDYYEGAIDVTPIMNSCSADAAYTTVSGTGDQSAGLCWNNSGPRFNRWFSFTAATTNIKVTVDRGGTKGSQRRTQIALWESDGTTPVACKIYAFNDEDVILEVVGGLTVTNTYYISIDAFDVNYDGTFTLCLADNDISYDYYEGALEIADINNWCSDNAAYTTVGGTPDQGAGLCWNNSGPRYNRWFYFVATTTSIAITVDRGGAKGSQRRTQIALWESDGTTPVACKIYAFNDEDVILESIENLAIGNTYYISIDAFDINYDGTFTLCVNNKPGYDFYEGAIELTDLNNWCSSDAVYTTVGATPDQVAGSCWNNTGPRFNRWFMFTAISTNVTITVDIGGTKGTQRRTQLALWQSDGTTEVDCKRYVATDDDVSIFNTGLTIGNVYYVSIDAFDLNYDGSFTLCIDNVDEIYYSRADGAWITNSTWSSVAVGGVSATDHPQVGDVANIEGYIVSISGTSEVAAEVNIAAATNPTGLILSAGSALDIAGQFNVNNPGNNINTSISISNSILSVNDFFTITRNGGTATLDLSLDNSTFTVNKNFEIYSTSGTNDNTVDLINSSTLNINGGLSLINSGGPKSTITINNSTLTVTENLTYSASTDNKNEIALVNSAILNLKKDVVRGTPAYGILNCAPGTTVNFNSTDYLQILPRSAGSGTGDTFTYENVVVNNSRITTPQLTLAGAVTINGTFTLTDGEVFTTSSNLLTIAGGGSSSTGSNASHVDGPMKKIGNTVFEFPVGDEGIWQPISINNLSGDASTEFTAEYFHQNPTNSGLVNFPLNNVSTLEYWDLSNTGTASTADVTLHWKDQNSSQINDYDDLVIAHYNGTDWDNLGQNSRVPSDPGSITVNGISSFSPFTFGSLSGLVNPLPVELVSFTAKVDENVVELDWVTASEVNNDYFDIERSTDGLKFETIGQLPGMGTSNIKNSYKFYDESPVFGIVYYRLRQVDYDRKFEYSKIISIKVSLSKGIELRIYPNPFEKETNISYTVPNKAIVQIVVRSISGKQIKVLVNEVQDAGAYNIPFDYNNRGIVILHYNIGGQVMARKAVRY